MMVYPEETAKFINCQLNCILEKRNNQVIKRMHFIGGSNKVAMYVDRCLTFYEFMKYQIANSTQKILQDDANHQKLYLLMELHITCLLRSFSTKVFTRR